MKVKTRPEMAIIFTEKTLSDLETEKTALDDLIKLYNGFECSDYWVKMIDLLRSKRHYLDEQIAAHFYIQYLLIREIEAKTHDV